jgi:hypothetical protein
MHYIVVNNCTSEHEAVTAVTEYIQATQDYEEFNIQVAFVLNKQTATNKQTEPIRNTILELLKTSPYGTADQTVIDALASRNRNDLKLAYHHLYWLYTTIGATPTNLNIWVDSINSDMFYSPGITNITMEYESEPEDTYLVAIK